MKYFLLLVSFIQFSLAHGDFEETILKLQTASFKDKITLIEHLGANHTQDPLLSSLLSSLYKGDLYFEKSSKKYLLLDSKKGKSYFFTSLIENEKIELSKKLVKKVKINNSMRKEINTVLATLNLLSPKENIRLQAAKDILSKINASHLPILDKAITQEQSADVLEVLQEARLNIVAKNTDEPQKQIEAIKHLGDHLSATSYNTLTTLANSDEAQISDSAKQALQTIEGKKSIYAFIEKAFFGLSYGSILFLASVGLIITFGVMKVINMAHGEVMMLGAYTTYTVQLFMPSFMEQSIIISIVLAFFVGAFVGILIERLVIRHLYHKPLETLLATFGISLILQQAVRSIFSALNKEVVSPSWMSGALEVNPMLQLTYSRLYIIVFAVLVFALVFMLMKKTTLGLKIRAVTQNREMAKAMGINTSYVDIMTFAIGSGIASVAGVALSQITNVGPNLGQAYIVDSFMVVVFGGVGNLWGTFIGSMMIGETTKFLEPAVGAVLGKVIILILIILFIQKNPKGLFPAKGRHEND